MRINPFKAIAKALFIYFFLLQINEASAWQLQPDLIVVESALRNSLKVDSIFNNDQCYIDEGCLSGTGNRQLIKFTTQISNVGDADFFVGKPPPLITGGNDTWVWDSCHNHWHYDGYAEYVLLDDQDNEIPAGFKSGFCLADIFCEAGYERKYTCLNQGISAHCTDVYSSQLDCQWIDVTNVPEGVYKLKVRVNFQEEPDVNGVYESTYQNNSSEVCFELFRNASGRHYINILPIGTGCQSEACYETTLTIQFDDFAQENSWQLYNTSNNLIKSSNGPYNQSFNNTTLSEVFCLTEDCYVLTFFDTGNDGICCGNGNGNYKVFNSSGLVLVDETFEFGNYLTSQFCITTPTICTDVDGDGICANNDCNDNNASVPAPAGAACNDNNPNTIHDEILEDGCTCAGVIDNNCTVEMSLFLQFDNFPFETSWELKDPNGFIVDSRPVYSGVMGLSSTSEDICLVSGCYTLFMKDTFGDGMCCNAGNGYYRLTNSFNEVVAEGAIFESFDNTTFCVAPCETDLTISSLNNLTSTYKASNEIIGVGSVSGNAATVTFSATQRVQLLSGFGVKAGSHFRADNDGCNN